VNSGDNQAEYRRRTRQGRLEGLFYLGCVVFALAIAFMLRG
jgi:hypothetical protein